MRLHNTQTGVQINVPDDKARRLIADGSYTAAPDSEQPPPHQAVTPKRTARSDTNRPTDIAAAIKLLTGPQ